MTTRSQPPSPQPPDSDSSRDSLGNSLGGSGARDSSGHGLADLADRSEALLGDLSSTRDDLLAPVDLNRMLRQLLTNQIALLRAISGGASAPAPVGVESKPAKVAEVPEQEPSSPEQPTSNAEAFLGVEEKVSESQSRRFVEFFDHRDQDFAKGLEKLNRWTDGQGGTPFQVREDVAFLNVGCSEGGAQRYEKNLMGRMGFNRRLGRLAISGLQGEIVVYERS
ncbi:MAG: hypothetical protein JKY65_04875 [Planctomycetes bacterium]|nr:hypothetical protein [Planctomycetota bacterium]